jgi:hypothetical protein
VILITQRDCGLWGTEENFGRQEGFARKVQSKEWERKEKRKESLKFIDSKECERTDPETKKKPFFQDCLKINSK